MEEQREAQVAEVLQLVVQHCNEANHPRVLCMLLAASARVNTALRECRGRCIVSACLPSCTTRAWQQHDVSTLGSWAGFARWLPKHAGLVSSLIMHQEKPVLGLTKADKACEQLLHSALQLSAMSQPAPAEREEGEFVTPPPPPLRLHEFRSLFPVDLSVLNALAAAQVQVAQLKVQPRMVLPFFCHALGSLTSLQELCITTDTPADEAEALPAAVLTAARRLQGLRRLELCSMRPEDAPRLRPNLQELDVTWAPCCADTLADLSHLSALRECTWRAVKKFRHMRALLPAQLTHAKLHSPVAVVAPGLSLQSAMVAVSCDEGLEVLQDLTSLVTLRALGVCVLPDARVLTRAALTGALQAIRQLTSLTELCLSTTAGLDHVDMGLGSTLTELEQLRCLELDIGPPLACRTSCWWYPN